MHCFIHELLSFLYAVEFKQIVFVYDLLKLKVHLICLILNPFLSKNVAPRVVKNLSRSNLSTLDVAIYSTVFGLVFHSAIVCFWIE